MPYTDLYAADLTGSPYGIVEKRQAGVEYN
jgi:hypothetical protein